MKTIKVTKVTVPMGGARLIAALILALFFVRLLSLNSYADDGKDLSVEQAKTVSGSNIVGTNDAINESVGKVKAYQVGSTTLSRFINDSWSVGDVLRGKLGILSAQAKDGRVIVVLGIVQTKQDAQTASKMDDNFEFIKSALQMGMSVTYKPNFFASRDDRTILAQEICVLEFMNDLLESAHCSQ